MSVSLLRMFLKQPITIVGIITALLFQVFFSIIWMTGYDHATDRVNKMRVAIVNEDGVQGQSLAEEIAAALPFRTEAGFTLKQAQAAMEKRDIRMIIQIPSGFSSRLGGSLEKVELNYFISQANPQMVANVMQNAAGQLTAALNERTGQSMLKQALIGVQVPAEQEDMLKLSLSGRIAANVQVSNKTENFAQSMVPLMMVTASFTGSMLLAMNLNRASGNLAQQAGTWQRLAVRFVIMGAVAVAASLIGTSMLYSLGIRSAMGYLTVWLFEFIIILSCMALAQLSLVLLGDAGAWLNIALLSLQMVSSGATVPREILPSFYIWAGRLFPASYAVDGMLDLVLGGEGVWRDALALMGIAGVCMLLTIMVTATRNSRSRRFAERVHNATPIT